MANKVDTAAAMAAFLARGGKVTTCAPAAANATPLRTLRAQAERNYSETGEYRIVSERERAEDADYRRENAAERYFEAGVQARLCGASASEALDIARHAANSAWDDDR
jgi:hypothetical protein